MKPSTSKASSSTQSPPPEEPTAPYVNDKLPDPDDEPAVSDMNYVHSAEEMSRLNSQQAYEKYAKARPDMIKSHRSAVTAPLFHRYTEDEDRKRMEQLKNKEAMTASIASASRNGHVGDNRKRRSDVTNNPTEEEWRRAQQQQQWMGQASMQHGFQMQQQYHQQQAAAAAQHHQFMAQHSVPTPGSLHQPSPSGVHSAGPSTSAENGLHVPNGEWFDKLASIVAESYVNKDLGDDMYGYFNGLEAEPSAETSKTTPMETGNDRQPSAPPTVNAQQMAQQQQQQQQAKMRILQQQEMQRMELQRQQHQMMQQQQQQQRMLLQQQQMQQNQMNGAQFSAAQAQQHQQQHAAYMHQMQRMQQMRMQPQHQQAQQQPQHPQQPQNGGMGYGVPNGFPHPNGYGAYGHHMPHHIPFANIN